ncbi:MAG: dTDP-4-dehydrorhamnose 3,5-epimerase [Verrucomicrobiae bacterium]|nr:dTDP-4-dehydrorhamnose 3,5-epimerase [Verrucomicrobiae bacterium]
MTIHPIPLPGAALIDAAPFRDHRGLFARFYCEKELASLLGGRRIVNVNFSRTNRAGAVRGLHFQRPPHQEMKLVRCLRGSVFDVMVDIRRESPTFLKWHGEILSAENMKMFCIPEGFAHGFQNLEDNSELLYLMTAFYVPEKKGAIRYDDPKIGITWPREVTDISEDDAALPFLGDKAAVDLRF